MNRLANVNERDSLIGRKGTIFSRNTQILQTLFQQNVTFCNTCGQLKQHNGARSSLDEVYERFDDRIRALLPKYSSGCLFLMICQFGTSYWWKTRFFALGDG